MKPLISISRAVGIAALLMLAACGDNSDPVHDHDDAGNVEPADASTELDAGLELDAAIVPLAPCLDRPDALPRPPTGALPCDLIPPSFAP